MQAAARTSRLHAGPHTARSPRARTANRAARTGTPTRTPATTSAGRRESTRAPWASFGQPSLGLAQPAPYCGGQFVGRRLHSPRPWQRHDVQCAGQFRKLTAQRLTHSPAQPVAPHGRSESLRDWHHDPRCLRCTRQCEHDDRRRYRLGPARTYARDIASPAESVPAVHGLKTATSGDAGQTVRRLRPFRRRRRRIARPLRVAMRARKPCRRLRRRTLGWYVRFIAGRGFLGRRRP